MNWKPGDKAREGATLTVVKVDSDGTVLVAGPHGKEFWIASSALVPITPLPSPDLAAANARVAEEFLRWVDGPTWSDLARVTPALALAVCDLRDLLAPSKPPDPVAELLRAANRTVEHISDDLFGLGDAIEAVEAARATSAEGGGV